MTASRKPVILCILDGWGIAPDPATSAPDQAQVPNFRALMARDPHATLTTFGPDVGLPRGQMGNSEVGHTNIGAGRVVAMDLGQIDLAIEDGSFARNPALLDFIAALRDSGGTAQLLGMVSDGGVHGHVAHLLAACRAITAAGVPVQIHAMTDGRDVAPGSASDYLAALAAALPPGAHIGTVSGRYYAMDRDHRWERVALATAAMLHGQGEAATDGAAARCVQARTLRGQGDTPPDVGGEEPRGQDGAPPGVGVEESRGRGGAVPDAVVAVAQAAARGEGDEFIRPTVLAGYVAPKDGDGLFCLNFRADRARQIMAALAQPDFADYPVGTRPHWAAAMGMADYSRAHDAYLTAMFPKRPVQNTLGAWVSRHGLRQFRLAETEKYPHVTFFLNGGKEAPEPGEDRLMPPSPKVATYDLAPEMASAQVGDALVAAIAQGYDLIVVNFANPDMVGHTGSLPAAILACEAVDRQLGRMIAALDAAGGAALICADHGNCEVMVDPETGAPHTAHTLNPVPVILHGGPAGAVMRDGRLADLAPTLLALMGLPPAPEMTGRCLFSPV